jgi:putative ATP-dependent endonuclease of OLD family
MKVSLLRINNFRCIKSAELFLEEHTLLVGKNNVGKSTVCEALDLLLGPERLSRTSPIDEYDFYNGKYLNEEGEPIQIFIEAVLIDLSEKAKNTFGGHLEFWHKGEKRVLELGEIDTVDTVDVEPCLRLQLKGQYDSEEDEFWVKTFYSRSPGEEDEGELTEVYRSAKREIGFLYLRAIRTGSRALSLERGSLLDILLRLGQVRPQLWEDTRNKLMELDPPLDDSIGALRPILDNIEARIKQYVPLDSADKPTRLFVSQLTREHLRKTVSFFMSTSRDQTPVPFQELGTGTLNTLVFALLSAIADLKKENVIFAMEEPEIAVSPHTQRRIVDYLLKNTSQSFITSHSPYVIEKFSPDQIKILKRDDHANVTSTSVTLSAGLKPKLFYRKLRPSIAEAILGQAVLIGEGLVEFQVLRAAVDVMETENPDNYPFDLSGITFFDADGDGNLSEYGAFFKSLGLKTFAFYDNGVRTPAEVTAIASNFDINKQTAYADIEKLLAEELPIDIQWNYLQSLVADGLLPTSVLVLPGTRPSDTDVKSFTKQALLYKKGDGRCAEVIKLCTTAQLPQTIREFLESIYSQYPAPAPVDPIDIENLTPNQVEMPVTEAVPAEEDF